MFLGLLVLAIPVSIIVLFIQVVGLKDRLERLERALKARAETAKTEVSRAATAEPSPAMAEMPKPPAPQPAPETAAIPEAVVASVAPLTPLTPLTPETPPARVGAHVSDQNRPLVVRSDRLDDLIQWLQGNWIYVVAAISLGLAGIFFVQYGMEKGLLPPGLRVLAALAFGAGLIGAGEWLRRKHGDEGATSTVNLPSVFSGAGVVTLFAAVLAARQLYGLIGPGLAFAGHLGAAGLAVGLGWLSGPLLVAVGLVGAFAAPFVVGGNSDNVDWLYGYFALIAGVGLAVDAARRWAWVSVLALVLGYGGGAMIWAGGGGDIGWCLLMIGLALLALTLPELRLIPAQAGPATLPALAMKGKAGWPPFPVRLAFGAVAVSTLGLFMATMGQPESALFAMAGLAGLAIVLLLWAEKAEGLDDLSLLPSAGLIAAIAAAPGVWSPLFAEFDASDLALRAPETAPSWIAPLLLVMAWLVSQSHAYRALRPGPWGVAFGLAAVLVAPVSAAVLELWWQPARVLGPYLWGLHLIALAAFITGLALQFAKVDAGNMRRAAHATLSALALIALALFVLTTKTALTLALAVLVVVAAALDRRFRLPEMSLFLQVGSAVLGYRLLADPGLGWAMDAPLGQVLLAFGGTIASMLAALWLMRDMERPMARAVAESAAAGLAAILANVLITRWLDTGAGGRLESHWGLTLNAMPWLILMLMQLYRARLGGTLSRLRRGIAALAGTFAGLGVLSAVSFGNPLFSWGPENTSGLVRGPYLLDTLFMAYALPGLILLAAALRLPGVGAKLRLGFLGVGAALVTLYAALEIRRVWQGDWLGASGVTQGELYTYTLAMMLVGAALLYQAIAKRSDTLRRIAMAVIGLTVAKVFLLDASGLTGLTRVVSFAGLGLSLAGLAWLNRWAERAGDKAGEGVEGKQ